MGKYMLLLFVAGSVLPACDNDFTPATAFSPKLAVFAVLEPTQEMQVVRLSTSYNAEPGQPLRPLTSAEIETADVRIRQGGTVYHFKDTVLTAPDGSTVRAWVSYDLKPVHETVYQLEVDVSDYPAISQRLTTPSTQYITTEMANTDKTGGRLRITTGTSRYHVTPGGYLFRIWGVVKYREGRDTYTKKSEIPLRMTADREQWEYPTLLREDYIFVETSVIRSILDEISVGLDNITAEQLFIKVYSMNRELYSYYKIVRGFDDPLSMRLNSPDISFIDGALGVFGAVFADSSTQAVYRFGI